ncbi:phospholipid-binding lipoprotein MlaA [Monaibacterium marinum]|uniref:Phospholipid-binding lipoprotein MlaA n=1 Tax=Pontivivens marinum TaxID=1690039 RepID=A0A2C9CNL6_9RHOB|nr:VacJ family lipoprotein [Monaibacterium marinum]SOH92822.1 phospholipid-binding lipoprotein MlaA [Monaibacterium marinum]
MKFILRATAAPALLILAACASPDANETALIADPAEPVNRGIHAFNKGADTIIIRPVSQAYGTIMPEPVERTVENFIGNLALPSDIVNNALQGDTDALGDNLGRFLMNTTLGMGGLLDVAGDTGIERQPADFGQTLATYGVGEGPYVELPLYGPSTARDAVGIVVDLITDPTGLADGDAAPDILTGASVVAVIDTRDELGPVLDGILYDSEDSYSAAQTAYIQLRRAFVNGTDATDEGFVDIYAE